MTLIKLFINSVNLTFESLLINNVTKFTNIFQNHAFSEQRKDTIHLITFKAFKINYHSEDNFDFIINNFKRAFYTFIFAVKDNMNFYNYFDHASYYPFEKKIDQVCH